MWTRRHYSPGATWHKRILRAFVGRNLLESFQAKEMLGYQHSGFSLDAGVCAYRRTIAQPCSGC
jgi:hypothetical protein